MSWLKINPFLERFSNVSLPSGVFSKQISGVILKLTGILIKEEDIDYKNGIVFIKNNNQFIKNKLFQNKEIILAGLKKEIIYKKFYGLRFCNVFTLNKKRSF